MRASKDRKSYIRTYLLGATIITVLGMHFAVSQFIFVEESAKDISVNELIDKQPAIINPENEAEKTETITITETVSPVAQPKPKIEVKREDEKETETRNRKKSPRESRAERLRRAEKILTGI